MKQQLWIINSSFIAFFVVSLVITNLLRVGPPKVVIQKNAIPSSEKKKELKSQKHTWEKIYKNDIFKTFSPQIKAPVKKDFVTPIPEPQAPSITPPPELPKQSFIDPIKITIKGIIVASDEAKNVAMIEDEAQKETLYHLGEKIKDAQVIKITKNRVAILRGNGQQEVFYLRKDDVQAESDDFDKWKYIVKAAGNNTFEIDPAHFKKEVLSLGNFLERSSVIGTAYLKGKPIGIRIGKLEKTDLGTILGLQENDIIASINDTATGNMKNRIKIYDHIKALKFGDSVKVEIRRGNSLEKISYKLSTISKAKKQTFTGSTDKKDSNKQAANLKMNKTQEREKLMREFNQRHPKTNQHKEAIARIRQRLLDNLKNRLKNARVR